MQFGCPPPLGWYIYIKNVNVKDKYTMGGPESEHACIPMDIRDPVYVLGVEIYTC